MDVTLAASVDEYFHEVVTDALEEAEVEASEPASWYLVNLLGEFTHARLTDEPLGPQLAAPAKDVGERVKTLKHVGDTSLYVAGYFAESLTRSLVDADYYIGLGQNAYAQLARSLGRTGSRVSGRSRAALPEGSAGGSMTDVYAELSDRFPKFVDVLASVRKRIQINELNATTDVSRLYEVWLRTREAWVEKKLKAAGVLVDPGTKVIQ